MTRVKICGITRIEDAVVAADLGAFAVGFVFWPQSPRCVDAEAARAIADSLPDEVLKVGVFVDQPIEDIQRIVTGAGLNVVQLHGSETAAVIRAMPRPVFKAVAVDETFDVTRLRALPEDVTVLLDAHDPVRRGGTGRTIDWSLAADAAARRPVILSGGITPENIRPAIDAVRPFAVDVSSGVEASPGVKDHNRLRALFDAIRHD
jgi:phosphoribosylanthranilate isomerase